MNYNLPTTNLVPGTEAHFFGARLDLQLGCMLERNKEVCEVCGGQIPSLKHTVHLLQSEATKQYLDENPDQGTRQDRYNNLSDRIQELNVMLNRLNSTIQEVLTFLKSEASTLVGPK